MFTGIYLQLLLTQGESLQIGKVKHIAELANVSHGFVWWTGVGNDQSSAVCIVLTSIKATNVGQGIAGR